MGFVQWWRMAFLLNADNILPYLSACGLLIEVAQPQKIAAASPLLEPKPGKNFNLRVRCGDSDLLVKQESHGLSGHSAGELWREHRFFQMLVRFPALQYVRSQVVQPLHFDAENSVIVFPYLENARDLSDVFSKAGRVLPVENATRLGRFFAGLHHDTFQRQDCERFAAQSFSGQSFSAESGSAASAAPDFRPDFLKGLRQLTPELFCVIPTDALKFFRFYQRYPEIGHAIEQLNQSFEPSCVVHNDPRFANFLQRSEHGELSIQPIDWEKWAWGDPAYDLARLVANYLKLWLRSLPISADLDLSTMLSRASVPLGAVQPSTQALVKAYLSHFPDILLYRPKFVVQLVQFAGLALIRQVQLYIAQKHPCGNVEMAMAQVAKTLLCQPEGAISTVFGCERRVLEEVNGYGKDVQSDLVENGEGAGVASAGRTQDRSARERRVGVG